MCLLKRGPGRQHRDRRSPDSRSLVSGLRSSVQREHSAFVRTRGRVRPGSSPREGGAEKQKAENPAPSREPPPSKASPGIPDKGPQVISQPIPWPWRVVRLQLFTCGLPDSVALIVHNWLTAETRICLDVKTWGNLGPDKKKKPSKQANESQEYEGISSFLQKSPLTKYCLISLKI